MPNKCQFRKKDGSQTADHPLATPKDVSDLLAQSINQLRRGELDPKVANAVGYLSTVLLRALEQGPLEERMAKLEAMLGLAVNAQSSFAAKDTH